MKQRPILFSTPMVQAIRKGTKTQTRRIVNPQPTKGLHTFISPSTVLDGSDRTTWIYSDKESSNCIEVKCKYGQPGDVLWVRESFAYIYPIRTEVQKHTLIGFLRKNPNMQPYVYLANEGEESKKKFFYKPSIHMPKHAARIWLRITNVRLERLFEISKTDAIAEGDEFEIVKNIKEYKSYLVKESEHVFGKNSFPDTPECSFLELWEKINGKESVNSNPFVWVIEFEQIDKPD